MADLSDRATVHYHIVVIARFADDENQIIGHHNTSWENAVTQTIETMQLTWCEEHNEPECPYEVITDGIFVSNSPIVFIGT